MYKKCNKPDIEKYAVGNGWFVEIELDTDPVPFYEVWLRSQYGSGVKMHFMSLAKFEVGGIDGVLTWVERQLDDAKVQYWNLYICEGNLKDYM